MAPAASPSLFERRLHWAGNDVRAVTVLLERACGLLRQLVCVAGWLVLLTATARLLVQPHIDPGHRKLTPEAGRAAMGKAEAIVLSCTGWPALDLIPDLRRELGKPVLYCNLATG